jgi:hypothetical protein
MVRWAAVSLDNTQLEQKEASCESRDEATGANSRQERVPGAMSHEIRTPSMRFSLCRHPGRGFVEEEHERLEYLTTIHAGQHLLALDQRYSTPKVESAEA